MKKSFILTAMVLCSLTVPSNVSATVILPKDDRSIMISEPQQSTLTEVRQVNTFHTLTANNSLNVNIIDGPSNFVKVVAPAKFMKIILTTVKNGELTITTDPRYSGQLNAIKIYAGGRDIRNINLMGSGNIETKTVLSATELSCSISGSGNIFASVRARNFKGIVYASGNLTVSGSADSADITIKGSGNAELKNLRTRNASAKIAGSGDISLYASDSVKVAITGSGDAEVYGKPKNRQTSKYGSGDISFR